MMGREGNAIMIFTLLGAKELKVIASLNK